MKFFSFDNCGQQLKTLAKVLRWLAVIAGLILFVVGLVQSGSGYSSEAAAGVAMLIAGLTLVIFGWIGSIFLYGFGVIVAAHEDKAASAASTTPVRPAFTAEDVEKFIANIDLAGKIEAAKTTLAPVVEKSAELKSKFSKASSSDPKKTKEGWICPKCDALNPNHIGSCQNCGESKPSISSASSSKTSASVGWRCSHCGTENSRYVSNCLNCGESKPAK